MQQALIAGFLLSLGLITAIGAQNAFVLRQGLQRSHVFYVCLTCAMSDALLIIAGVVGFGALISAIPRLEMVMTIAGAVFLMAYALKSFWSAYADKSSLAPSGPATNSLLRTIAACLAFTWLNPHVYLDTVVLLGSVSVNYGANYLSFASGAVTASFVFFFSLGYGARLLAPFFVKPGSWRVLELLIGITMTALSVKLLLGLV